MCNLVSWSPEFCPCQKPSSPSPAQEAIVCVCCSWGYFSQCRPRPPYWGARFPHRKVPPTGESQSLQEQALPGTLSYGKSQTPQECPPTSTFSLFIPMFVGRVILEPGIVGGSCCQWDSDFQMVISGAAIQPHPASQPQDWLSAPPSLKGGKP